MPEPEIFCPKCKWRPKITSRWMCDQRMGGCNTVWNTFLTGGVCPSCAYSWEITACLSCKQFSLHKEWYHYPEGSLDATNEELERVLERA
jgi:hypothetical protein